MSSIIKVQDVQNSSGANIINESSNTITIGASGDNIIIPSGATITNNGTSVGLGGVNTPAFLVSGGGAVTISDDTWTKIQLGTENLDTDNAYDNATNYRFAPTEAGQYFVFAGTKVNANQVGELREVYLAIYKNGSIHTMLHEENLNNAFDEYRREASGSTIIDMNGTSDYLELYVYINNTTGSPAYTGSGVKGTRFGAYKLIGA